MLSNLLILIIFNFITYLILYKISFTYNLLDFPNDRKKHIKATPLIGGLIFYLSLSFYSLHKPSQTISIHNTHTPYTHNIHSHNMQSMYMSHIHIHPHHQSHIRHKQLLIPRNFHLN